MVSCAQRRLRGLQAVLLVLGTLVSAPGQDLPIRDPKAMLWHAQELEERGRTTEAWALYNHIATLDPKNALAAGKASQLRAAALEHAEIVSPQPAASPEPEVDPTDPLIHITEEEVRAAPKLLPPPSLAPKSGKITLRGRGDGKKIYPEVLKAFGIEVIFDGDYENPSERPVILEDASFEETVRILNTTYNSFVVPLADTLVLVLRDNDQKRREQERTVAITMPIPTAISAAEAQELARALQQLFELQRLSIDTNRGTILLRDRWSKVIVARRALEQMLNQRGQVIVEVELYEISDTSNLQFGLSLPTSTQLFSLAKRANLITGAPTSGALATFGGGMTLFGLGITSAKLFASMTYSHAESLYKADLRLLDALPGTLHIGDRYPIITAIATTASATGAISQFNAPQVQFEDLGLTLKVTPHMHGNQEITLEVESEFKVLTGQSSNNIPVIASRKYAGTVRLEAGEWAVATGLLTKSEARTISGVAGLSQIPVLGSGFSSRTRNQSRGQTLLLLRPRILSVPAGESNAPAIYTGSENRFVVPLQ